MAGRDKICECCREYIGPEMHNMSKHSLQICKPCRKTLQHSTNTLYIALQKYIWFHYTTKSWHNYNTHDFDANRFANVKEWEKAYSEYYKVKKLPYYSYGIAISKGKFIGYSRKLSTVKRKIKRILQIRSLKIIQTPSSFFEDFFYG